MYKRPIRCGWTFSFALAALLSASTVRALEDPAVRVQKIILDNGLTVLTLEDPSTPVVSFQMWVRVGSRDEARYTGLAHLFEHMMFKGSKHVPPERHAQWIEARGGQTNAFTTRDETVYYEDVTPEALPLVIDLEAERVAHLDISKKTLASEREVVLEERRLRFEDDPEGRAFEAIMSLAFQAHPYRWPVIGWRSDVEAVGVETCREFFSTYYSPNNLVLSVAGNFDAQAALARIRSRFGDLEPAAAVPRNPTREPEQEGERRAVVYDHVRSPILVVAWHAPAAGHVDAEALDVAGQILSVGRSSRLYRRLVYEDQVALFASGGYWEMQQAGLFYTFVGVRPTAALDAVETSLLQEIERLIVAMPSAAEVEKAKRQLEVGLVSGLRTSHALASRIAGDYITFGRVRSLDERLEAIRAVTPEKVQQVARRYLVPARRNSVRLLTAPEAGGTAGGGA